MLFILLLSLLLGRIQLRDFSLGRNIQSNQTSSAFLRICADPRSADFCMVLVRSLIPNCSKWPASFFDTEPNASTTTGTIFVLDFQILLISLARCWYFSYFSVAFCSTLLSPRTAMLLGECSYHLSLHSTPYYDYDYYYDHHYHCNLSFTLIGF